MVAGNLSGQFDATSTAAAPTGAATAVACASAAFTTLQAPLMLPLSVCLLAGLAWHFWRLPFFHLPFPMSLFSEAWTMPRGFDLTAHATEVIWRT